MKKHHKKLGKEVKDVLGKMNKDRNKIQDKSEESNSLKSETSETDEIKKNKKSKHTKKGSKRHKSVTSDDESETHSDRHTKNKVNKSKKKKIYEKSKNVSESDSELSTSESKNVSKKERKDTYENIDKIENNKEVDVKVKKRETTDKKISVTKSVNSSSNNVLKKKVIIKSDEWTEPQFFNNYKIDLDESIQNLQQIILTGSYDFPLLKPIVDSKHNVLCIVYKNDTLPIELEPRDDYTLNGIITETNEALNDESIPIKMYVDKKGFITIENTKGELFSLDLTENSIGPYLGYQEQSYNDSSRYVSECPHMFLEQSYFMFIKEISPERALCEITPTGEVNQLIKDISNNNDLKVRSASAKPIKSLTIQYRYNDDIKSQLTDFYEEPHEISFDIYYEEFTKERKVMNVSKKK